MNRIENQLLTYVEPSDRIGWAKYAWYRCRCGNMKEAAIVNVNRDSVKSCGKCISHGMTGTRFYRTWKNMKVRTTNPKYVEWRLYGGRGITLDPSWHTFANFKKDMYDSYVSHANKYGIKQTTIERINVNGNYTKDNVRWATTKEQMFNRRNTIIVDIDGVKMTVPELADSTGISRATLYDRYYHGRPLLEKKRRT